MNVSFPGTERQGALLGLNRTQAIGCALALIILAVGLWTSTGILELFVVVAFAAAVATFGLWPVHGLTAAEWGHRVGRLHTRKVTGTHRWLSDMPITDNPPPAFKGWDVLACTVRNEPVGVLTVGSGTNLTYSTALTVGGTSFGLASTDEQERRIGQWGSLVATLGESLVARIQVIARVVPADPQALTAYHAAHVTADANPAWNAGYTSLLDEVASSNVDTELTVVMTIDFRKRGIASEVKRLGGGEIGRLALIGVETDRLWEQLASADVNVGQPLTPVELARQVRLTLDPFCEEGEGMWPSAMVDRWGTARCDNAVHASFWVSGWPQREVEAGGFMAPLLLRSSSAGHVRTFTLVVEPMHPDRALSKVETTLIREEVEMTGKAKAGFAPTERKRKMLASLKAREKELVDGHTDTRYLGVVTVSAVDDDALAAGVAEMQRAAHQSHLRVRRQYGAQGHMLSVILPAGRGFERKRFTA